MLAGPAGAGPRRPGPCRGAARARARSRADRGRAARRRRPGPRRRADRQRPPGRRRPGPSPLTVLDGPEPGPLLRIREDGERLDRTMVVVTGDDAGTETLRQVFAEALADHGLSPAEAERRFVTVAEPGAAAAKHAMEAGHPLVEAPAATAFGALSPTRWCRPRWPGSASGRCWRRPPPSCRR
ncbi:hypothetical protein [Actinomadura madurae]|uniref:hypothetical protein n=1 Tax=Actinomadura madurae TaxID=1993 RepID=UPI0020D21CFC|nr:hypothetical protein [Actinomadura madurae]MCQ0011312.1 hypothetical protein [Actinomadura madurae]